MSSRKLQITALFLILGACVLGILQIASRKSVTEKDSGKSRAAGQAPASSKITARNPTLPDRPPLDMDHSIERLTEEHEFVPDQEEWAELTRLLLYSTDGKIVDAVTARFVLHAGTAELAVLSDAYRNPPTDEVRQRLIDLFSCLNSAHSMDAARRVFTREDLPITDHLVCASAISLVRFGEPADLKTIFGRLNGAGEDPSPEGSLFSDADGLMFAISEADHPRLQPMLMQAARGDAFPVTGPSRYAALAALRNYTNVPSTEVLFEISSKETNLRLREQAAASLEKIKTPN